ncbi:MAG: FecR domain-containing protein [Gemmatimonadaceae bacterium]
MSNDASGSSDSRSTPNSGPPVQPDWDAIARYLAGESSPAEATSVERWLDANPADRTLLDGLNSASTIDPEPVNVEAALKHVHSQMQKPERPKLVVERGGASAPGNASVPRDKRRLAMIVTLAAAAAAVFVTFISANHESDETTQAAAEAHVYSTAIGQRDSILLADGSRIILGPDSRLTVDANYGTTSRSVELHGDAYFDVHHDPAKPFSVRVAHALIEDIGTTFAVESDAGDTTTVSVLAGSVRLRGSSSAPNSGEVLAAGDRGSVAADGRARLDRHAVADDTAWTSGRLVFKEASLVRVMGEIRRWYGVQIQVTDTSLLNKHVVASFNGDDPIDQVLKILGLTLGATVEHQGDRATLTPVHGPAPVR